VCVCVCVCVSKIAKFVVMMMVVIVVVVVVVVCYVRAVNPWLYPYAQSLHKPPYIPVTCKFSSLKNIMLKFDAKILGCFPKLLLDFVFHSFAEA